MSGLRSGLVVGLVGAAVLATARLSLRAQDDAGRGAAKAGGRPGSPAASAADNSGGRVSVQDALERPLRLPFREPTRLDEVCRYLGRTLNAPVVLDRAALDRQELLPDDTVEIELDGVRLKTGLKLLLDQVGLTYRVVAGDNLLVLTDDEGADDPLNRVLAELKALHRDLHDVQDAVDEVRSSLGLDDEGPKVRKPTIIEEMPAEPAEKAPAPSSTPKARSGM